MTLWQHLASYRVQLGSMGKGWAVGEEVKGVGSKGYVGCGETRRLGLTTWVDPILGLSNMGQLSHNTPQWGVKRWKWLGERRETGMFPSRLAQARAAQAAARPTPRVHLWGDVTPALLCVLIPAAAGDPGATSPAGVWKLHMKSLRLHVVFYF